MLGIYSCDAAEKLAFNWNNYFLSVILVFLECVQRTVSSLHIAKLAWCFPNGRLSAQPIILSTSLCLLELTFSEHRCPSQPASMGGRVGLPQRNGKPGSFFDSVSFQSCFHLRRALLQRNRSGWCPFYTSQHLQKLQSKGKMPCTFSTD